MPHRAVPAADASLDTIFEFAMTYFGYDRHGGVDDLAFWANFTADHWQRERQLPARAGEARAALFYEARRWHHFGDTPDAESEAYIRALLTQIAELSGGTVAVDREGPAMWLRRFRNRRA
jgi:hypothetical protein